MGQLIRNPYSPLRMAGAGRGGLPSEAPFTLDDLNRSLQMTSHETDSSIDSTELPSSSVVTNHATAEGSSIPYFTSTETPPSAASLLYQHEHPGWYQQRHHRPHNAQAHVQAQAHTHVYAYPPSGPNYSPPTKIKQEPLEEDEDEDDARAEDSELGPDSKKRKRNKPTLSCKECVDKKMKASRTNFSFYDFQITTVFSHSLSLSRPLPF